MTAIKTRITADEFFLMPQGVNKVELVDGELVEMPPVGGWHSSLQVRIGASLLRVVEATPREQRGHVGVELGFRLTENPDTVRGPDVSYIAPEQLRQTPIGQGFYAGHPDIAVEVVSPNDTVTEIEQKVQAYLRAGTRLVWVANPDTRSVMVFYPDGRARVLAEGDTLSGEDVLPGYAVRLRDLFDG